MKTDYSTYIEPQEKVLIQQVADYNDITFIEKANNDSIGFNLDGVGVTAATRTNYYVKVRSDISDRNINMYNHIKNVRQLQQKLSQIMKIELELSNLRRDLNFIKDNLKFAPCLTENCCPCFLHMEMRTIIKLITLIIKESIHRAKSATANGKGKAAEQKKKEIENLMKTQILGNADRPHSYALLYNSKEKQISEVNFNNGPCRKFLEKFDLLIDAWITVQSTKLGLSPEVEREKWKLAIQHYRNAIFVLLSKTDVTDDEIIYMQHQIDYFAKILVFDMIEIL